MNIGKRQTYTRLFVDRQLCENKSINREPSRPQEACMSSTTELSKFNHCKNLAKWQQMVYDCRNSGMTVRAWCASQGICEKSYYYRQRKVWDAAQQADVNKQIASPPSSVLSGASHAPAIIPCTMPIAKTPTTSSRMPALVLQGRDWTVEVSAGCDPELLRLVLESVK